MGSASARSPEPNIVPDIVQYILSILLLIALMIVGAVLAHFYAARKKKK